MRICVADGSGGEIASRVQRLGREHEYVVAGTIEDAYTCLDTDKARHFDLVVLDMWMAMAKMRKLLETNIDPEKLNLRDLIPSGLPFALTTTRDGFPTILIDHRPDHPLGLLLQTLFPPEDQAENFAYLTDANALEPGLMATVMRQRTASLDHAPCRPKRLCVVDDHPGNIAAARRQLQRRYALTLCSRIDDAYVALSEGEMDAALLDVWMPAESMRGLLRRTSGGSIDLPGQIPAGLALALFTTMRRHMKTLLLSEQDHHDGPLPILTEMLIRGKKPNHDLAYIDAKFAELPQVWDWVTERLLPAKYFHQRVDDLWLTMALPQVFKIFPYVKNWRKAMRQSGLFDVASDGSS